LGEKAFEEGTVLLQLRVNVRSLYFTSNTPSDGLDEEGNRSVLDVCDRENRRDRDRYQNLLRMMSEIMRIWKRLPSV
jgi:hypothetical protein